MGYQSPHIFFSLTLYASDFVELSDFMICLMIAISIPPSAWATYPRSFGSLCPEDKMGLWAYCPEINPQKYAT